MRVTELITKRAEWWCQGTKHGPPLGSGIERKVRVVDYTSKEDAEQR